MWNVKVKRKYSNTKRPIFCCLLGFCIFQIILARQSLYDRYLKQLDGVRADKLEEVQLVNASNFFKPWTNAARDCQSKHTGPIWDNFRKGKKELGDCAAQKNPTIAENCMSGVVTDRTAKVKGEAAAAEKCIQEISGPVSGTPFQRTPHGH
ncbi:uncharacterized protein LOC117171259 isoform X2 [Belonocnema kinseyi]|uniref:uncharacterized protein LOC117171259 isoform X2 n=1 Tax=Belonocnema kinseyi TaxID=2817044 RepID=UPI00143DD87C|nr:uncharacterized protein LOC117171259 isoform X2 [Belonocnema kinseyi]